MKIAVYANDAAWNELTAANSTATWIKAASVDELFEADADAFFNLTENIDHANKTDKPYFISSVINTLKELPTGKNIVRFNGWRGFLQNDTWEICGAINDETIAVLSFLNKKYIEVADEPGLISARIISMIINEAFFAEGEKVSEQKQIDVAMKLGVNYPRGPFEWADLIGLENVYNLLKKLSADDARYNIAPLLEQKTKGSWV